MIKVGNRVTYKYKNSNETQVVLICTDLFLDELATNNDIEILKIERPNWEVVEEKKDLLTEEEREFYSKV